MPSYLAASQHFFRQLERTTKFCVKNRDLNTFDLANGSIPRVNQCGKLIRILDRVIICLVTVP